MKKIIYVLIVALLLNSLFGCSGEIHYLDPLYPAANVTEIKIIELKGDYVFSDNDYILLKEIEISDVPDIWDDILAIEYKSLGLSPGHVNGTAIMIVYESGEYEIRSRYGLKKYAYSEEHERIMEFHSYYRCRDAEQFDRIVDNWLDIENTTEVGCLQ